VFPRKIIKNTLKNRGKKDCSTVRDKRKNTPHLCNIKTRRSQKRLRRRKAQKASAKAFRGDLVRNIESLYEKTRLNWLIIQYFQGI
jgi:hypothetical protein